jgi:hypothetical protein
MNQFGYDKGPVVTNVRQSVYEEKTRLSIREAFAGELFELRIPAIRIEMVDGPRHAHSHASGQQKTADEK